MTKEDAYLFAEWIKIHRAIGVWPSLGEFFRLRKAYSEPSRYYHTWHHIFECLRFLNRTYGPVPMGHLIKFALFYHDIVYAVPGPDNEVKSAMEWQKYGAKFTAYGKMPRDHFNQISDMIVMTKSHKILPHQGLLFQIMSDVDMSIIGALPDVYLQYARDIWQEYKAVGREAYLAGRLDFLSKVDSSKLFYTHQAKRLTKLAAANLNVEKLMLEQTPEAIMGQA